MDNQNIQPDDKALVNSKRKKITWFIAAVLLFILQPLYLQYFPIRCSFMFCDGPAYAIALIDFVWILTGLSLFFPQFKTAGVIKHKIGRTILIVVLSFYLGSFVVPVTNAPFDLYRYITRPQLSITSPLPGTMIQVGNQYELLWESRHMTKDSPITVFYEPVVVTEDNILSEGTIETIQNTGKYTLTLDPQIVKSGQYYITVYGGGKTELRTPYGVSARILINVTNSNDSNLPAYLKLNEERLKYPPIR